MTRRQPNPNARTYTDAQKAEALDLAADVGLREAARRLGYPDATVRSWQHRAAKAADKAELMAVAAGAELEPTTPATTTTWQERRVALLPRLGEVAAKALDAAEQAVAKGDGRNAQALLTATGIAIDKAQLLAGGATRRSEQAVVHVDARVRHTPEEVRAEVERMRRELGYADAIEGEVVDDG